VLRSEGAQPHSVPCPLVVQSVVGAPHSMHHQQVFEQLVGLGKL
jgi:hypothetical protein